MNRHKSQKHNNQPANIAPKYTLSRAIANYYVIIMLTLFPLFFTNRYYNIRHDKFFFFIIATGLLFAAEILMILTNSCNNTKKLASDDPASIPWYKQLTVTDWLVLAFLFVNIISTIFSVNFFSALFGESETISSSGRNNGLLLVIFYVIMYFIVSRMFHYFEYIMAVFSIASSVVFLLAILNAFYIDPFFMSEGLSDKQNLIFISTIGNIDLMSSFICIALPVSIAMAVYTKKLAFRIVYFVSAGLGFASLMVSNSNSGILGIGIFLVIYFVWCTQKIENLKRYFLLLTVMLMSAKVIRLFSLIMHDKNKGIDVFQSFFIYNNLSYILIAIVVAITVLLYILGNKKPNLAVPKIVTILFAGLFIALAITLIGMVIYFSFIDTTTKLGSFERLLRFNEKWGTHRGIIWIKAFDAYKNSGLYKQLFGTGPDTFYFAFEPYFNELAKYGDTSTNAAHNEYINQLITTGAFGLATYLAVIAAAIARAVKYAKQNPFTIVCACAIICYSIQAFVNIAQPITTPFLILFIALSECAVRQKDFANL